MVSFHSLFSSDSVITNRLHGGFGRSIEVTKAQRRGEDRHGRRSHLTRLRRFVELGETFINEARYDMDDVRQNGRAGGNSCRQR